MILHQTYSERLICFCFCFVLFDFVCCCVSLCSFFLVSNGFKAKTQQKVKTKTKEVIKRDKGKQSYLPNLCRSL